jgi:hypothetical protein
MLIGILNYESPLTDATEDADIDFFMWPLPNYNPEKVCYLPVCKAARNGHINIVKYLLSKGKKVNGGRCPYLPPSGATRDGHIDFIEYLVSHGADANGLNIRYCPSLLLYRLENATKLDANCS